MIGLENQFLIFFESGRFTQVLLNSIIRNQGGRIFRVNITTLIKALLQNGRNMVGKR